MPADQNDQKDQRPTPAAGTEPSTALDDRAVQPGKRDKSKDPDTLENDEAIRTGKDPDNID